jgi:negative regulator of flagellin synthesis FlgM
MTNRIGPVDPNMVGKIGNSVDETSSPSRVSTGKGKQDAAAGNAAAQNDTVNLTSGAQLLERLEKSLDALPAIDSQRVAEVRAAIEKGDYEIDATAVADAMILLERSLGE